jgi:polyhydroxyalkanoate synthesis repressor PhaR
MNEPLIIKKYSNRRLYHMGERRYINLDELEDLVQRDVQFKVVDASDDHDITRRVLLQVLLEQAKGVEPVIPSDVLRFLIKQRGLTRPWEDTLRRLLTMTFNPMNLWSGAFPFFGEASAGRAASPPPEAPQPEVAPPPSADAPASAVAEPEPPAVRDELDMLRRKMEELEQRLGK